MQVKTFNYTQPKGWQENPKDSADLDSKNTLVLIFASPIYYENRQPIEELAACFPQSITIGCSSAGEICGHHVFSNSITVAIVRFEKTELRVEKANIKTTENSYQAGEKLIQALQDEKLKGVFILSDGLNVNGSELVKGLNSLSNNHVAITGGLAGDGSAFKKTWTIANGEIQENLIIAVGMYSDALRIGHGSRGGWDIFGPERRITHAKRNVLFELDNKPALKLYKEYLGERASGLPATGLLYPLAIRHLDSDKRQLVRTILAVNEDDQSLTFAGDVPTGYLAQLMRANFDRLIEAADNASSEAVKMTNAPRNKPVLAIAVSCVGRRLLLGERIEEETEATFNTLPTGSAQVGFYSYGEIAPYISGNCDLHNQTMTMTTIYED